MVSRREFIKNSGLIGVAASTGLIVPSAEAAQPKKTGFFTKVIEPRNLKFTNMHTGETFDGIYKRGNFFIPDALEHLAYILRDHRTGDIHQIDKELIDYLHAVKTEIKSDDQFTVLSGFRSQKTNEMLRRRSNGVAKHSYHTLGRAMDISLPGYSSRGLFNAAKSLKLGGTGFYKSSGFVHLDTGPVRDW